MNSFNFGIYGLFKGGASSDGGGKSPEPTDPEVIPTVNNPVVPEDTDYYYMGGYGQSFMTGAATTPSLSRTQVGNNLMLGDSHHIGTTQPASFSPLIVAPSESEALMPPMVNAIKAKMLADNPSHPLAVKPIIAATAGEGGQTVASLLTEGAYSKFRNGLIYAKAIADAEGKTISSPVLAWIQGGADGGTERELFKSQTLQMMNKMRDDVIAIFGQATKPIVVIYQANNVPYTNQKVYRELELEYDWILNSGPVYAYPDRDGTHFDTNGSRWFGEFMAKRVVKSIGTGIKDRPLMHTNIEVVNGSDVVITFNKNIIADNIARPNSTLGGRGFVITTAAQKRYSINGNKLTIGTDHSDLLAYAKQTEMEKNYGGFFLTYRDGNIRTEDGYQPTTIYEQYEKTLGDYTNPNFQGYHLSEAALNSAIPSGQQGWYAEVIVNEDTYYFDWNTTSGAWVARTNIINNMPFNAQGNPMYGDPYIMGDWVYQFSFDLLELTDYYTV